MTDQTETAIDRIPLTHSVRYVARGLPEVPNQYGPGVLAPSEITLTYRSASDSQLGRVHAYVAGRIWVDGSELPLLPGGLYGQHYDDGLDGWPAWLAEEARLHDPDAPPAAAGVAPAADDAARRDRYAAAMAKRDGDTWPTQYADDEADYRRRAAAVMAVADAELAELRAEVDRLGAWVRSVTARAETAEAAHDRSHKELAVNEADRVAAVRRAEQAEELLAVAHETSNRSEAERARAVQRAEAMERAMQSTAADAAAHRFCHMRLMAQCQRAEQAEARVAELADDLRYVLDYRGPGHAHEKPGVWDTSGKPCEHCARLAVARQHLDATDGSPAAVPDVDRAALLREAADEAERVAESLRAHHEFERSTGALDVMTELRRMAGEAQHEGEL